MSICCNSGPCKPPKENGVGMLGLLCCIPTRNLLRLIGTYIMCLKLLTVKAYEGYKLICCVCMCHCKMLTTDQYAWLFTEFADYLLFTFSVYYYYYYYYYYYMLCLYVFVMNDSVWLECTLKDWIHECDS